MSIPRLLIHQEYARIGIDADLGEYEMKQPRPTFELQQTPAKQEMRQPQGDLQIDQSKAWDALALGNNLQMMSRIYSQAPQIALQGIAKIVEDGNRMAAIHLGGNPIADMGQEVTVSFPELDYAGPASYDNVDIHYTARKPEINTERGTINLNARVNKPEVEYHRGKLDIYLLQRNKVEFTPPAIDRTL